MGVGKGEAGLSGGYRFGVFVNVVLICLLGTGITIGIVAAVRQLSYRVDLRFDTTQDKRYELDPLSKQLLRDLEAPLRVWYCWGYDQDLLARVKDASGRPRGDLLTQKYRPILQEAQVRIRQVLQEWEKATPQLELVVASQERSAAKVERAARELGLQPQEMLNRIIVRHAGRHREIPLRRMMVDVQWGFFPSQPGQIRVEPQPPRSWRVREELVATLRSITAGETIPVGIVRGLRGRVEPGSDEYGVLTRILQGQGYQPIALELTAGVPDKIEALILGAPRTKLDERAARHLETYERKGGRVLVCASAGAPETFERLLQPYGVRLPQMLIADDTKHRPSHQPPGYLESSDLCAGAHPIVAPLKKRVRIFFGIARPLEVTQERAPGANRVTLMQTSPFAQADVVQFDNTGRPRVVEGRRRNLPNATIAVALDRKTDTSEESRVVVLGTEDIFQTRALLGGSLYGNRDLLLNAMAWLVDRKSAIGLLPRTELKDRYVSTRDLETPFTVVAVVLMPLLAVLGGLIVFFARRS